MSISPGSPRRSDAWAESSRERRIRPADDVHEGNPDSPQSPEEASLPPGGATNSQDPSDVNIIFEMTKSSVDLQFQISERIDAKIRNYFAAATTVFGLVQGLVLIKGVHKALGDTASILEPLTIAASVALGVTLVVAVVAMRPRSEKDIPAGTLRDLLNRSYAGEQQASGDAVNLLIGLLERRKQVNEDRRSALRWVISLACASGLISLAQLVLVVIAVL